MGKSPSYRPSSVNPSDVIWFHTLKTITGEAITVNTPFTYTPVKSELVETVTRLSVCRTVQNLTTELGVSGSISGAYLGDSVSDKAQFVRRCSTSSCTTFIAVYACLTTHSMAIDGRVPTQWTDTSSSAADLYEACGDAYTRSAVLGAETYAVYSFATETEEEQQSLVDEFSARGIVSGAQLSADLQASIDEVSQKSASSVRFEQQTKGVKGWDGKGTLVQYIQETFPKDVAETGGGDHVFQQSYGPLETLAPIGPIRDGLKTIDTNVMHLVGSRNPYSDDVGLIHSFILASANRMETAKLIDVYEFYGADAEFIGMLRSNQDDLDGKLAAIKTIFDNFDSSPDVPLHRDSFPKLHATLPKLRFERKVKNDYGNHRGAYFSMDALGSAETLVRAKCHVVKLMGRSGTVVDRFVVTYEVDGSRVEVVHGGGGGGDTAPLEINDNDRINMIFLRWANGSNPVGKLEIATSGGGNFFLGNLSESNTWVRLYVEQGYTLLGYESRADDYITSIFQVQVKMLQPHFERD